VLGQAAGFAVLADLSPTAALLVMAVLLGADNPRRTALRTAFLLGPPLFAPSTTFIAAGTQVPVRDLRHVGVP
jgi:hypothetical protein